MESKQCGMFVLLMQGDAAAKGSSATPQKRLQPGSRLGERTRSHGTVRPCNSCRLMCGTSPELAVFAGMRVIDAARHPSCCPSFHPRTSRNLSLPVPHAAQAALHRLQLSWRHRSQPLRQPLQVGLVEAQRGPWWWWVGGGGGRDGAGQVLGR